MKKSIFLISFSFLLVISTKASSTDSISTVYKNSEFVTYCQVLVNASDTISNTVLKDFEYQMCYNLDALYGWGLKGMNLRKEKSELMMFYFKSTSFNNKTAVLKGVGDVIVPGVITIPDINVYSKLSSLRYANGKKSINMDLISSSGFIKKMNTSFSLIPLNGKGVWYTLEAHIRFGWFFDIFITQSRFKSIMEWRLKRFIHNLKDEAERREKK